MEMTGEYRIAAPRETVWKALNDPEILAASIPGCKELEQVADNEMTATVVAKVGPVKATFKGHVTLGDIVPPESYTISGEGKGGVAGFAKGGADVHLAEDGEGTILTYTAKAQVGGKLAQLGSRLIDSTAKKMADEFFSKFSEIVGGESEAAASAEPDATLREVGFEHAVHEAEEVAGKVVDAAKRVEHEAEEKLEKAAARGFLGGPVAWALWLLGFIIIVMMLLELRQ
ncbi:MAG: carbon monoxide dehydrogenase [Hyphomicrobiales bacterium]|nr:MAG: carbon monoxide dehydrogenase [Hyphomicrobiales bacterium]